MINEKDLRIGNCLEIEGVIRQVTAQTIVAVAQCNLAGRHDFCKPIPLSPEILEKAGFEKQKYFSDKYSWVNGIYLISLNGWFQQKINITSAIILSENIHYVHQIQNIYYTLTGTEIIINL